MKKVLITMAVLASMVAGVMVFSSFAAPKQNSYEKSEQVEANVPTYWEGYAMRQDDSRAQVYLKVYQAEGMCNSFYAIGKNGEEFWVKENPDYDRNSPIWWKTLKYYITSYGQNYYFNM